MSAESQSPQEPTLRESEERYRTLLEDQTEVICRFRSDGTILFVNEVYCRFFGKSAHELTGNKWQPLAFPDDLPHIEEQLRKLSPAQPVVVIENRVLSGIGQVHWMQFVNRAFFDPQGRLVEMQAVGRDITERQRAQDELRISEERYRLLVDTSLDAVLLTAPCGRIYSANAAACRMFGSTEREIIQMGRLGLVDESDPRLAAALAERARTGRFHGELTFLRRDGSKFPGEISTAIFHNHAGEVRSSMVIRDITERKRAEERYRTLFESMDEGFCVVEMLFDAAGAPADYRFVEINPAFERHTGLGQALGKTIRQMVPDHEPYWFEIYGKVARTGEAIRFQKAAAAMRRYYDVFAFRIGGEGSSSVGILFTDITERRQVEQNLQQLSHRLLRLQDEERRRLARELHDTLAQELAALLMQLNLLQSALPRLKPAAAERLASSLELATRCANEVRTMSYMLHPPLLEALGLAGAVRDYADGLARRSGLRVDLEISEDVGRWPREVELALFRVLQEALANAHRHSGSATASIRLVRLAEGLRLEVADHGHGLGTAKVADAGANAGSGMGVGIPGMRERLRQLGGHLEIKSSQSGTSIIAFVPEFGQDVRS